MAQRRRKESTGIALCFSGGGYRAAAFHLGVLAYLNHIQLLPQVEILSTVSGGTLAGLTYAYSLKKKKSFEEFYKNFHEFLSNVNLVKLSFANIGKKSENALGFEDLITSIADVYDAKLFSGDRFELFWQKPAIHLQEIIFNATEFRTGIDFRFQKSRNDKGRIGNGNVSISLEDAQKIRLADIAAASSCFPGGFEPLAFPQDFQWPDNVIPQSLKEKFIKALPLMDGGIYDNQGIDAALLAIKRHKTDIGMFIISDTDKKNENLFAYPERKSTLSLSLNAVNKILLAMMALSIFSGAALLTNLWYSIGHTAEWIPALLIYGFSAVVLLLLAYGIYWLRHKIKTEVLNRIPKIHLAAWNEIKHLTIDQVIDMAALRVTSLFALASSVFMKRIRSLVFAHVYDNEEYEHKRVSNLIYELDGTKENRAAWLKPSAEMQEITRAAAAMPTTLWFDDLSDLQKLIACGEYSICYNLIDYILRIDEAHKMKYPEWFDRVVEDWKKFERDPMMMVR
ncbi:MAG: patatin-like phospholipase family protein [Ignavibacteriales bacterium]|nr:patatin-like phospholipase family protein [Ignavibacteriales bacterium]